MSARHITICLLLTAGFVAAAEPPPQTAFFERMKDLCGARFEGTSTFPADPGDAFRGATLVAFFESCDARQVKIPFHVGDDTSRTWYLTRTDAGLELKHDHRHADGSPDEITNYGGKATAPGTGLRQSFPADDHTAALIREAATNKWFLTLSEDGETLTYELERHGKPRFAATLRRVRAEPVRDGALERWLTGALEGIHVPERPVSLAAHRVTHPDGTEHPLAEKRGSALLVNLWSRGCLPCKQEMPDLAALQRELGDERFEVVALPMDTKKPRAIRKTLAAWGATVLVPYASDPHGLARVLFDAGLFTEREVSFIYPTTYLVNVRGEIVAVREGFQHWDTPEVRALIVALKDDRL
jgi:thiol-disulfide isomerase/thioredoxin